MTIESGVEKFPATASTQIVPGLVGDIEIATDFATPEVARYGTAIICHPHPLQGGTMHNKVVTTLARALCELGLATLRFNFRGVGASQGRFDNGVGESDDALQLTRWVQRERPGDAIWIAGFSFGSYVALRVAAELPAAQLITVAPAVTRLDFNALATPKCPWLVVQGEADEVVDPAAVYAFVASRAPVAKLARMPDTGHFFHRKLIELRKLVQDDVAANLPPLRDVARA